MNRTNEVENHMENRSPKGSQLDTKSCQKSIQAYSGGFFPKAAISKAKPIRGIFKSANPGVGVFPPLFEPFVGGGTTGIADLKIPLIGFALEMASWAGARSPAFSAGRSPPGTAQLPPLGLFWFHFGDLKWGSHFEPPFEHFWGPNKS